MKILLDTHLLLWTLADEGRLSGASRRLILDRENYIVVSVVSLWEVTIKVSRGKLVVDLAEVDATIRELGFDILDVGARHVRALPRLPEHHRDPFDRMLIAQATVEKLALATSDRALTRYGEPVLLV